ncbi:hypothetical protein JCM6882_002519 [Rhodosporidiobolus microsporus]
MLWPFSWAAQSSSSSSSSAPAPPTSPTATKSASSTGGGGQTDDDADAGVEAQTALATWSALLKPFEGGGALPEKARTDPRVKMAAPTPMTVLGLWQYLPFVARQSTSLTKAFVQHHLYGPPKPSWGVELTLFTTFLREVSSYSHLSSLARLRSVLELGSLLPTPKDGIVTPISFRVRKRNLRGILSALDEKEDGTREIGGEWVTNKRLWRKMTREWMTDKGKQHAGAAAAGGAVPSGGRPREKECTGKDGLVCLYLHGGAYYMFSAETHRYLTISVSRYCEARVFAINYRLAPETRFPGQLHDAVSAYMRLTVDLKIPPENIIFAGDSAGGGLVLATLMYLRDEGYPLPSGAILMSPWCDLTMSCASWETNRPYDYLPSPGSEHDHLHPVKCLLGDSIDEYLTHPYVSPLFGDFKGLPPLLVQAGDAEVLRDEITLLAHKAALAGVKVEHEIFEDCVHVFQAFLFLEASRKAFQSQRTYVKHTLPRLRRKAAASASASRTTSVAPSPTASSEVSTDRSEFDFAEVDREVVHDAHKVDQSGKAEEESLPPTPQSRRAELPHGREGDIFDDEDDEDDEDEEEEDDPISSDERMSDSTASPANFSPAFPASTPTKAGFPPVSPNLEEQLARSRPSPGFASAPALELEDPTAPPLPPPPSVSSSSAVATSAPQRRPILRAYASARDLSMSNLHAGGISKAPPAAFPQNGSGTGGADGSASAPGTTASSPTLTRKRRSFTTTSFNPSSSSHRPSSSTSTPSSPRFTSRPLAPLQQLDQSRVPGARRHSRTPSHPEFEQLLRSFNENEGALKAKTRVWASRADDGRVE